MSKNKESTVLTLDDLLKMTVTPKHIHQIVRRMNEPNFTDCKDAQRWAALKYLHGLTEKARNA